MIEQFCISRIILDAKEKVGSKIFCDNCQYINIFKIQIEMQRTAETNADNCRRK